jgi:hypothetical protein
VRDGDRLPMIVSEGINLLLALISGQDEVDEKDAY